MGKKSNQSEKQFDANLAKIADIKPKKGNKMKNIKETVKTWTIVILVAAIAMTAMYLYAFNQGYNQKNADVAKFNAAVVEQVKSLKQ